MDDIKNCPLGIENRTRLVNIDREIVEIKSSHEKDKNELFNIIKEIRDKLLGRPSWLVLIVFSTMSSALVGLLLLIMSHALD